MNTRDALNEKITLAGELTTGAVCDETARDVYRATRDAYVQGAVAAAVSTILKEWYRQ